MDESLDIEKESGEKPLREIEAERPEKLMKEVLNEKIEKMWMSTTWRRRGSGRSGTRTTRSSSSRTTKDKTCRRARPCT